MKALVVYESMFGNTAAVAQAIGQGLSSRFEVEVREVAQELDEIPADVHLLVIGAPTHAFSLSRQGTRVEAHRQGAGRGDDLTGLREWLTTVRVTRPPAVAAFDTRVDKVRHLPGSAARKAARLAAKRGLGRPLGHESFYVTDTAGPLLDGELDRARRWATGLAEGVAARHGHPAAG